MSGMNGENICRSNDSGGNRGGYEGLDVEWVLLMTEAKKMGLIPQEIRQYLRSEEPDWPAIRKVRKVQ